MKSLGEAGEIEPETEGMLIENGVDFSEFPQEVILVGKIAGFSRVFLVKILLLYKCEADIVLFDALRN